MVYYASTIFIATGTTVYLVNKAVYTDEYCITNPDKENIQIFPQNDFLSQLLILFIFLAVFSTVFICKKLFRTDFNKQGRSYFFKKTANYVIFFTICWQFVQLNTYYYMFKEPNYSFKKELWSLNPDSARESHSKIGGTWLKLASSVMILGSGIILSVIRMLEPYF